MKPIITIDGSHEVNEVHFEDVRVPVDNLVGEEGKGWTYGKVLLQHERTGTAGVACTQYRLSQLREQTTRSVRGATPLNEDRNFMRKIAAVEVELKALEYTELRTLAAVTSGEAPGPESSILKIRGTETKWLLKRIASRPLPREWVYRRKEGFSIPMKHWLGTLFRPILEEYLNPSRLRRDGIFEVPMIERLKHEHLAGSANHSHILWSLIVFHAWKERWLGADARH